MRLSVYLLFARLILILVILHVLIKLHEIQRRNLHHELSVAAYSDENFKIVQEIFSIYTTKSGGSFPQNLFRSLEGMADKDKTPFLIGAVGTNGLKQAKIATIKKRQRVLHQLLAQEAGITIEEVYNLYEEECAKLNEYADENISMGKVPNRIFLMIKDIIANKTIEDIQIDVRVTINGKEVNNSKIEKIITSTKEKIRITMKKETLSEE
ncbi:uncharacterized protein LOC132736152 [Ruditapes philippinarum]|uniref:uncharacterized protein LOC132736152 n=1 Tax=Ruditapes philippinarum TaxID=129788 RepID=UPI00295AD4F9|nr:uncharacterized protein LOC132736152 [Ruditapes philippinarum]